MYTCEDFKNYGFIVALNEDVNWRRGERAARGTTGCFGLRLAGGLLHTSRSMSVIKRKKSADVNIKEYPTQVCKRDYH